MVLTDEEVKERIESPLNLLNRLKAASASPTRSPSLPPTSEEIIGDLEDKIKVGKIKNEAAVIMADSLRELKANISNCKPEKLAEIAERMNKIVSSASERDKEKTNQIIVYAPQVINESYFESVLVRE